MKEMIDRFLNWPLPKSVRPDPCVMNPEYPHRIGTNLLTATEAQQMLEHVLPTARVQDVPKKPGYYWAQWRIPAEGTHEGKEQAPSLSWEIVQVNANSVDWENDPEADEALSVSVPGVRETQWRDCFVWGDFVSPLKPLKV